MIYWIQSRWGTTDLMMELQEQGTCFTNITWARYSNLLKISMPYFDFWLSDYVRILHMPWYLSCRGMCKILTRSDHCYQCEGTRCFCKIWVISVEIFCVMGLEVRRQPSYFLLHVLWLCYCLLIIVVPYSTWFVIYWGLYCIGDAYMHLWSRSLFVEIIFQHFCTNKTVRC